MTERKKRTVPFFNYPLVFSSFEEDIISIIRDVGRRGAFIMQKDLEDFEHHMADYVDVKYAIGVGNATDGLHMAVRAAEIGPGDEVIFCSHTMVATAGAIYFTGATPVPVDCGPDHLIDPESVKKAITPRTRAIIPTQLNGRTADMEALQDIVDEHGLLIIEDSAQALGSKFMGKAAGTFGTAGVISFYPAKTLGCLGDGGLIFTNSEKMNRKLRLLRDHGRNEHGDVVIWGLNSRLDNVQAAILDYKLFHYNDEIRRRREIAAFYQAHLENVSELLLPPAPNSDPHHFDIFQNYEIEAERRDELQAYLKKHGIGTLIQWGGRAVHQFKKLGFDISLPIVERMFARFLMLPMNTSLSDEDVLYVCKKVVAFYG